MIERGPSAEKVVSGMVAELYEEPWRDPRDYVLIDSRGDIKGKFTVTTWSIEDELGASVFAIADGALRNLSVSVFCCEPVRVNRTERTVVGNLQVVSDDDDNTLSFLSSVLSRHEEVLAGEAKRQSLEADARIAAIPGAGDEYGIGEDFRRAQEMLQNRLKAYDQRIDGALLTALARFGSLHRIVQGSAGCHTAVSAAFTAALVTFVIACRLAAFDRSLGRPDAGPSPDEDQAVPTALPVGIQAELRGLEGTLEVLERDLLQQAEWQEWSDALNNAMAFRAAAAHVSRSRAFLENCLSEKT